jgi:hypothetical protein
MSWYEKIEKWVKTSWGISLTPEEKSVLPPELNGMVLSYLCLVDAAGVRTR